MLVLVKTSSNDDVIPEIWETEEDKELSIGKLKYRYLQNAKQTYQGKVFKNRNTGKSIRVSADGIMEWWRKSRKREHIISIQLLDIFLENAVFIGESPDYKNRPEIENASQFEIRCKIDNKPYNVILITRKGIEDIDKFRYLSLQDEQAILE
jgi:hypothetical protein